MGCHALLPKNMTIEQGSLIYKKITLNCLLFPFLSKGDAPVKTNMAKKISSRHICMQPQVHCLMKELRSTYRGWRPGHVCANVYSGDGWIWDCGSVCKAPNQLQSSNRPQSNSAPWPPWDLDFHHLLPDLSAKLIRVWFSTSSGFPTCRIKELCLNVFKNLYNEKTL